MITVCAASRRLTLSNALQRIYRAEVFQQRLENPAVACYKRQQLFAPASASSWLSQRPFSTSPANANEESSSTSDVPSHNGRSDDAVLTELTSTKADNTAQRSKSTKDSKSKPAKSKTNEKKTIKEKKTGAKFSLQYVSTQKKPKLEPWQVQKKALKEKFEQGWHPRKKLAPDTLDTIRHLNATKPDDWTTPALAEQFKVSPEAIRRILKSKWQPSEEERQKRQDRWHKRHERLWSHMEQLGLRPEKGEQTAKLSDARRLGLESPRSPSS